MALETTPFGQLVHVCIVASWQAGQVEQEWLDLPSGSQVRDALSRSRVFVIWQKQCAEHETPVFGVWAKKVSLSTPLHDGDRLEIYRPLRVDPKVARRERFLKQGVRSTGLFARRRPGSKPGY